MLAGLFASIYRYERIAMILKGTKRFSILEALKTAAIVFAILSSLSFLTAYAVYVLEGLCALTKTLLLVNASILGLSMTFDMILDLTLGIRMTILVLESVRRKKLSNLKSRLLAILGVIIALDFAAVSPCWRRLRVAGSDMLFITCTDIPQLTCDASTRRQERY